MSTMDPAGEGGGGRGESASAGPEQSDTPNAPSTGAVAPPGSHPPPSPLSGCYLLVVLPEPHTAQHKDLVLSRLAKGFLSWDKDSCHVDLEKELQALVAQAPEGEEARNGERLIQYATENLVTEVLIHPQTNTLLQCIRNLLASFTKHRHIIHAGYTFSGNGSWILQDGTFSLADFLDAFSEHEVQRVLRAYENSVTVDIHCAGVGDWSTSRLSKEACTRSCRVRVNPDDVLTAGVPAIASFTNYVGQYLLAQTLDQLMEPSDVVGNIRFSHPTLYVFPGGQGDAALFGINGFNMLVDGGFARKACFWDFARHLDRLDAVLVTRINNSNIGGMSSVLRKKKEMHVYPQIGHFFCNLVERRQANSPDGDKDVDPLILNLTDIGQEMMVNLRHISLRAHPCYRDPEPINLYHKVGHGTLDMYVLSPSKDSREVREFLTKWHATDSKLFAGSHRKDSNNLTFPIQNLVSICALLVWQPANPEDTITRILFPGSTPQVKIFEGLERLRHLEFTKHPVCSAKSLSPSTSLAALKDRPLKPKAGIIDRETKKASDAKKERKEAIDAKRGVEESPPKSTPVIPTSKPQPVKMEVKTKKVAENKKIERESKESKKIERELKEVKKESRKEISKVDRPERQEVETQKTEITKVETEKTAPIKEPKAKAEPKKKEVKETKAAVTKSGKTAETTSRLSTAKQTEKKAKASADKRDVKSSPTTPKKIQNGSATKVEISKTAAKTATKTATKAPGAKSAKDANNRKVIEQKNIELSSATGIAAAAAGRTATGTKVLAKPKAADRKPISRRAKPVSPSKPRLPASPAKSTRSTPTASVKSDKDGVVRKVKGDRGTTDSSTVSTPSAIEPESVVKLVEKSLTEKSEDLSLDSIESKVLADLKEEREVVEEIEAVLKKAERIEEARKDDQLEGDDEITAEATDKKEEDVTEEDVTAEIEDALKKESSRKGSQELTEEDEYLIVEKEEIYTEDSAISGEAEQKHLLDEVESEKDKSTPKEQRGKEEKEKEEPEEKGKEETPEKKMVEEKQTTALSPERKERVEEELKGIIASATEIVQKSEERDDHSGKKDSEDITKEPSSLSPDKLDSSEKKTTDTDPKPGTDQQRDPLPEKLEESQERVSTLESGATTTAPTLPEDERITLDEIKEDIAEKHIEEEVKEKEVPPKPKDIFPELAASAAKPSVKVFDVRQSVHGFQRDIVKTPDEVADLPVHEEVDPKLYRMEEFEKEEKAPQAETKEPPTPPVKEQKGVFSFFGKVADKFEKGIDKLTGKSKKDNDKDVDEKSSKSSSPKELKPPEKIVPEEAVNMEETFAKVGKIGEKRQVFEQVEPKQVEVKVAAVKDTAAFLREEIKDVESTRVPEVESIAKKKADEPLEKDVPKDEVKPQPLDVGLKAELEVPAKDEGAIEDVEEVNALLEEASKKFKTVKDSLRDSLESLDEKIEEEGLAQLTETVSVKDTVKDTLTGVVERLEEIKPRIDDIAETKEPEKVKFDLPVDGDVDGVEEEEDEEYGGPFRDVKEAVRDVGEVLAGTAGIVIDDKPKDVVEIVKKVAQVLKEDDFLVEPTSLTGDAVAEIKTAAELEAPAKPEEKHDKPEEKSTTIEPTKSVDEPKKIDISPTKPVVEDIIIPKKVGVTEELPPQEEIEEMLEGGIARPLPIYERADAAEILEEPCVKVVKDREVVSPQHERPLDAKEFEKICQDMSQDDRLDRVKRSLADEDEAVDKIDVMKAGMEKVCEKVELKRELEEEEEEEEENKEIEEPEILFEQKMSPGKAEIVMVTPGSTPSSPKFIAETAEPRKSDEPIALPKEILEILGREESVEKIIEEIIEEFVVKGKRRITIEIIEYIVIVKGVRRERVIYIIEEIIIRKGIPRENVVDNVDMLKEASAFCDDKKRIEIEEYILKEYINKGRKITLRIIEEISLVQYISKRIIIEIIEEIIVKRKISRESVLDIPEEELVKTVEDHFADDAKKGKDVISEVEEVVASVEKKRESIVDLATDKIPSEKRESIDEDQLIDGFVSVPSIPTKSMIEEERTSPQESLISKLDKDTPIVRGKREIGDELIEKSEKDVADDFEAVEQEYKVSETSISREKANITAIPSKLEEDKDKSDVEEAVEEDVNEVVKVEKFMAETEGKLDDIKKELDKIITDEKKTSNVAKDLKPDDEVRTAAEPDVETTSEASEVVDTTEKYLVEAKEKTVEAKDDLKSGEVAWEIIRDTEQKVDAVKRADDSVKPEIKEEPKVIQEITGEDIHLTELDKAVDIKKTVEIAKESVEKPKDIPDKISPEPEEAVPDIKSEKAEPPKEVSVKSEEKKVPGEISTTKIDIKDELKETVPEMKAEEKKLPVEIAEAKTDVKDKPEEAIADQKKVQPEEEKLLEEIPTTKTDVKDKPEEAVPAVKSEKKFPEEISATKIAVKDKPEEMSPELKPEEKKPLEDVLVEKIDIKEEPKKVVEDKAKALQEEIDKKKEVVQEKPEEKDIGIAEEDDKEERKIEEPKIDAKDESIPAFVEDKQSPKVPEESVTSKPLPSDKLDEKRITEVKTTPVIPAKGISEIKIVDTAEIVDLKKFDTKPEVDETKSKESDKILPDTNLADATGRAAEPEPVTEESAKVVEDEKDKLKSVDEQAKIPDQAKTTTIKMKMEEKEVKEDLAPKEKIIDESSTKIPEDESRKKEEEEEEEEEEITKDSTTIRKMVVTATSEDGGHETELCPTGSITFPKTSTPDDSLSKDISVKSTPDKDSLVLDKDSLHSGRSTPEKDSIDEKSSSEAKGSAKVTPEDSLDKSPIDRRASQDLEDSLERSPTEKPKGIESIFTEKPSDVVCEKPKSPEGHEDASEEPKASAKPEDVHEEPKSPSEKLKSSEKIEDAAIVKEAVTLDSSPDKTKAAAVPAKPESLEIAERKEPSQKPDAERPEKSESPVDDLSRKPSLSIDKSIESAAVSDGSKSPVDLPAEKAEKPTAVALKMPEQPASEDVSPTETIFAKSPSGKPDLISPVSLPDVPEGRKDSADSAKLSILSGERSEDTEVFSTEKSELAALSVSTEKDKPVKDKEKEEKTEVPVLSPEKSPVPSGKEEPAKEKSAVEQIQPAEKLDAKAEPIVSEVKDEPMKVSPEKQLKEKELPVLLDDEIGKPDEKKSDVKETVPEKSEGKDFPVVPKDEPKVDTTPTLQETMKKVSESPVEPETKKPLDSSKLPDLTEKKPKDEEVAPPSSIEKAEAIDKFKAPDTITGEEMKSEFEKVDKSRSPSLASEKPDAKSRTPSPTDVKADDKLLSDKESLASEPEKLEKSRSPSLVSEKPDEKSRTPSPIDVKADDNDFSKKTEDKKSSAPELEKLEKSGSPSLASDKPKEISQASSPLSVKEDEKFASDKIDDKKSFEKTDKIVDEKSSEPEKSDKSEASGLIGVQPKEEPPTSGPPSDKADEKPALEKISDKKSPEAQKLDKPEIPGTIGERTEEKPRSPSPPAEKVDESLSKKIDDKKPPTSESEKLDKSGTPSLIDETSDKESRTSSPLPEKADDDKGSSEKIVSEKLVEPPAEKSPEKVLEKPSAIEVVTEKSEEKIPQESEDKENAKAASLEDVKATGLETLSPGKNEEKIVETPVHGGKEEAEKTPDKIILKEDERRLSSESKLSVDIADTTGDKAKPIDDKATEKSVPEKPGEKIESISAIEDKSVVKPISPISSTADKEIESTDKSRSPSVVSSTLDDGGPIGKSRSSSIVSEKFVEDETIDKSKSPIIDLAEKIDEKVSIIPPIDKSKPFDVSEEKIGEKVPATKPIDASAPPSSIADKPDEKDSIVGSKSPSIVSDKSDEKGPIDRSKSPSVASDISDSREIIDGTKSPCISEDKFSGKELPDKSIDRSRSPSVISDHSDVGKESTDVPKLPDIHGVKPTGETEVKSRSSSVFSEASERKAGIDGSKSPSALSDHSDIVDRDLPDELEIKTITQKEIPSDKSVLPTGESLKKKADKLTIDDEAKSIPDESKDKSGSSSIDSDVKDLVDEFITETSLPTLDHKIDDAKKIEAIPSDVPKSPLKSPSIVIDDTDHKDHVEQPGEKSRSSSIVSDTGKPDEKPEEKSRSSSIVGDAGKLDEKPEEKSRSPSIVSDAEKLDEKLEDKSRSSSIVSDAGKLDKKPEEKSRSPSIAGDTEKSDKKPEERSRSSSIVSDAGKSDEKPEEKSRSSSIVSDKMTEQKESVDKPVSPAAVSDKLEELKEELDKSKSPEKSEEQKEDVDTKSRSASIVPDEVEEQRKGSVSIEKTEKKEVSEKPKSPIPVSEKIDEISKDESKPSSVADEKIDEKLLSEKPIDKSRSPSIASDKSDEKESIVSDKKEISEKPKSPTSVTEKIDEVTKDVSKPSSIVDDKIDEKLSPEKPIEKSRSPSIASDKTDEKESIVSDKVDEKISIESSVTDNKLPSIVGEKPEEKETVTVGKFLDAKSEEKSRSPSVVSEHSLTDVSEVSEGESIEKSIGKSGPPSVASDKSGGKPSTDVEKTVEEVSTTDEKKSTESLSPSTADGKVAEKDLPYDQSDKSRSPSIASDKTEEKSKPELPSTMTDKSEKIDSKEAQKQVPIAAEGKIDKTKDETKSSGESFDKKETEKIEEILRDAPKVPSPLDDKIEKAKEESTKPEHLAAKPSDDKTSENSISPEVTGDEKKQSLTASTLDLKPLETLPSDAKKQIPPDEELRSTTDKDIGARSTSRGSSPVDEKTPKDRSRSHSLFEAGEKTPLGRSRAASLFEDKTPQRLDLLEGVKATFDRSASNGILEEKDEPKSLPERDDEFESKDEVSRKESVAAPSEKEDETTKDADGGKEDEVEVPAAKRIEIEKYVTEEYLNKKRKITLKIVEEIVILKAVSKRIVMEILEKIIVERKIPRESILDIPDDAEPEEETAESKPAKQDEEFEEEEVPVTKRTEIENYIVEQYVSKNRKISFSVIEEIFVVHGVPRYVVVEIIEKIIVTRKIPRESILEADVDDLKPSEIIDGKTPASRDVDSKKSEGVTVSEKSEKMDAPPAGDAKEIPTKTTISTEELSDDKYHDARGEPTPEVSLAKDGVMDASGKSTPDPKAPLLAERYSSKSGFSTPEAKLQFEDKSGKSSPDYRSEYESQFHKAFVGGMTEIRTTHITTLSGKSTPDFSTRDGTPDSASETTTTVTASSVKREGRAEDVWSETGTAPLRHPETSDTRAESSTTTTWVTKTTASVLEPETRSGEEKPVEASRDSDGEDDFEVARRVTKRVVTEEEPEVITRVVKREIRDRDEPEVVSKIVKREIVIHHDDEEGADPGDFEIPRETCATSDARPEVVKRIISREGTPEVVETITTRTTRTIVTEEIPVTETIARTSTAAASDIEKPELYTRITSREGTPEITETIKRTTKTVTSDSGPEYVTRIISREGTPEIPKSADVKRIVTTLTTITGPDGEVVTKKDVRESEDATDSEELLEKLIDSANGEKNGQVSPEIKSTAERYVSETPEGLRTEEIIKRTVTTVTSTSGTSSPDVKTFYDSGKSTPDSKRGEKCDRAVSQLIKDSMSDEGKSYSGKSSPDASSTGRSTPEGPAATHSRLSGRSTPDRKSEGRPRTATPEGFRSGEVIRTILTTTRTMSDDGEIVVTTKEVTETTNDKGETVVLAEKIDVKIDDALPGKDDAKSADLKRGSSPDSDIVSDRDATGATSLPSEASSEPPGSPLSMTSQLGCSPQPSPRRDSTSDREVRKTVEFASPAMSGSFYGELPTAAPSVSAVAKTSIADIGAPVRGEFSSTKFTAEKEFTGGYVFKTEAKKYVDEADLDFEKALLERKGTRAGEEFNGDGTAAGYTNGSLGKDSSSDSDKVDSSLPPFPDDAARSDSKKDPLEGWGTPLGLPSPKPPRKLNPRRSTAATNESTIDTSCFEILDVWGEPLGLPSPAPLAANELSNKGSPGTPKKERKQPRKVVSENNKNKKRSESPGKNDKKSKDLKNKVQPVYLDLTYVPHHGNSFYTSLEFFKKVRARYYVFSGTEPSREVYDALLEAKKTWEDKDLEVTMIPTYDTDTLGYWVADNEEALAANHIDLSPSASRCTINLQDHETSCSAYRLEF